MGSLPVLVKIFILCLWLTAIPVLCGGFFGELLQGGATKVAFRWLSGQILLWAVFQLLCVPLVLKEAEFPYLVAAYLAVSLFLAAAGGFFGRRDLKMRVVRERDRGAVALWILFAVLLAFQLIQAVRLAYADGDDAFYVAVSTITNNADTMYQKLPYTGGTTGLDTRHGLAPFPIWIAFLARISGLKPVGIAHVVMPLMLLPMTYLIFALIGRKLFGGNEKRLALFLIFTQFFVIFGDVSLYTAEHFMVTRSRQGKALLGSVVIPFAFWLVYEILECSDKRRRTLWALLVLGNTAACLCSTLGAVLMCLFLGVAGVCIACSYKNFRILIPLAATCIPCAVYAALYLMIW